MEKKGIGKVLSVVSLFAVLLFAMSMGVSAAGLTQQGLQDGKITVAWTAPSMSSYQTLTGYTVYMGTSYSDRAVAATLGPGATSYTAIVPGGSRRYISVEYSYKYRSTYSEYDRTGTIGSLYDAKTAPVKVSGLNQARWWYYILSVDIKWNPVECADGYNIVIYDNNNKVIKKDTRTRSSQPTYSYGKVNNNKMYKVQVQAYTTLNGQTVNGPWSDTVFLFTSPTVTSSQIKNGKLTVKWQKVGGATAYNIYVSTKNKPITAYKKVATVSAKKASATIKKFNKKKFNPKKKYYVYVETVKKNGKVTSTSGSEYYWKVGNKNRNWF